MNRKVRKSRKKKKVRYQWVLLRSINLDELERVTLNLLRAVRKHRISWEKNKDASKDPTRSFLRTGSALGQRSREMHGELGDQYIGPDIKDYLPPR